MRNILSGAGLITDDIKYKRKFEFPLRWLDDVFVERRLKFGNEQAFSDRKLNTRRITERNNGEIVR